MGALGISPDYFLDEMSVAAFALAYEGYDKTRKDSWEQTRLISFYTARPYLEGNPSITRFMPLQWDMKKSNKKSTRERFNHLESKLTKLINNG